ASKVSPGHSRPTVRTAYVAPASEIERQIAAMWQELLGIEQVGIHDNFFELGGHSLMGTQLMTRLRKVFRADLALRNLFEAATVGGVAESIQSRQQDAAAVLQQRLEGVVGNLSDEEVEAELSRRLTKESGSGAQSA